MWMTIQQYADQQGISYQAARKAFLKYRPKLVAERHVKEERRTTLIDKYAADFLSSKREQGRKKSLVRGVRDYPIQMSIEDLDLMKNDISTEDKLALIQEKIDNCHKMIEKDTAQISNASRRIVSTSHRIQELEIRKSMVYDMIINEK